MKRVYRKFFQVSVLTAFALTGCKKILDETPRATFTPDFFKTQAGVQGGITSLYGHLRYMYGNGYFINSNEAGTDEETWAQLADLNTKNIDFSGVGTVNPQTDNSGIVWNNNFPDINTASGVIENGAAVGISDALIAEARFFRSFDYFLLVQTFGGVPLDLGAGELKFNTSTARTSKRNTVPEVYTKAIFPDLLIAIDKLPTAPRVVGGVTKNVARLYLAKAYLTYGWWLQNPNNIPTYPDVARTDPAGHDAAYYFNQAYTVAAAGIESPTPYSLQASFYDVNVATNDRNNEVMLFADHTQSSAQYNGGDLSYSSGGFSTDNFASWFQQWNYTTITSSKTNSSWSGYSSVQRAATQPLGRPWTLLAPPQGVFKVTFADKLNDSRYDGTFVTRYRCNLKEAGYTGTTLYNANYLPIGEGDAVLSFLNDDVGGVDYTNSVYKSSVGAGVLPGRADFVIEPSNISRICYPGNFKLGPYRTDNNGGLGSPNGSSTRPFPVAKFSELFFIAAEAAVKGAATRAISGSYANDGTARGLINVIRARAGRWRFDNGNQVAKVQDNSAAIIAATPASIDINYILAERSREYFGEGYRWFDLVRTQKWTELSSSFVIAGKTNPNDWNDHTVGTFTRTILPMNYLKPIPQSQLDGLDMSPVDKKAYQNPGYN
ncbi:putative outer membrane starch-binding protein [Mucilaginibacter gracilis]|uniref:RagB/SusD domain-containing protein n=2 Tax=Mucilaginibacter TaxID=423349 RepID=H1YHR1_9SPHI|nr:MULTISPECIES: RagB/SusD family nutrient uptake outer membrane protein [Mucilaginibacter]EHQ27461.1 RagB/SusD domain-containing protein [Mucilaginibacter paludis DSM 18603]RKR81028.1 putative outer membrane starch-binding protein [Mucilaginibacter gracilis]